MACGACNKGNNKKIPQVNPAIIALPNTPRSLPPVKGPPARVFPAPPGSYNPPGRFCSKCGWVVATVKYADPSTNTIVEKKSCTNRKCSDYR